MGFIRDPKGIDFVIDSGALSDSDRAKISLYIREYVFSDVQTDFVFLQFYHFLPYVYVELLYPVIDHFAPGCDGLIGRDSHPLPTPFPVPKRRLILPRSIDY
jgi:hypothetical protein